MDYGSGRRAYIWIGKDYWRDGFFEIQTLRPSMVPAKKPACESYSVGKELDSQDGILVASKHCAMFHSLLLCISPPAATEPEEVRLLCEKLFHYWDLFSLRTENSHNA